MAEDVGEVVAVGQSVAGFDDCVETHDWSTLDPALDEHKFYCRGIGTVLITAEDMTEELVDYAGL